MDAKQQLYSQEGFKEDMRTEKLTSDDEPTELLGDIDFKDTSSITNVIHVTCEKPIC